MLITFSGLDGAGKSTLVQLVQTELEKNGRSSVIFHMNKDVGLYAYLRTIRDAILPGSSREDASADTTERPPAAAPTGAKARLLEIRRRIIWNKGLRRWIDLGDLALFHAYRFYIERVRRRVLIMDRYFYDRMADIADGRRWNYLRWFSRIAPVPDIPIFVDLSPEQAFARKGEYSVDSMTRRRALYREIFSWVPGAITLRNDDLETTARELERIVAERLGKAGQDVQTVEA